MHNKLDTLRDLYEGDSPRSHRFRDSLFIFDLAAITYVIFSSFWEVGVLAEGAAVSLWVVVQPGRHGVQVVTA